jgi:hypothetical protein
LFTALNLLPSMATLAVAIGRQDHHARRPSIGLRMVARIVCETSAV